MPAYLLANQYTSFIIINGIRGIVHKIVLDSNNKFVLFGII